MRLTIANLFSFLRIIIAPIFFIFVIRDEAIYLILACILYILAAITDYIDGWLARKYNEVTSWGKFLDPLADKVLTSFAFIAFVELGIVPLWMVIIIIIRDLGTTFLRVYANKIEMPLKTSWSAKTKTFLQMLFIAFIIILLLIKSTELFSITAAQLDYILFSNLVFSIMLILTVLTLWTAFEYVVQNKKLFLRLFKK